MNEFPQHVSALLGRGANVLARNKVRVISVLVHDFNQMGNTPLHLAIKSNAANDLIHLLLDRGEALIYLTDEVSFSIDKVHHLIGWKFSPSFGL
jgi:ankyrin repeat protein